jgi:cytochrome P450
MPAVINHPPGPRGTFLIGSARDFASDRLRFMMDSLHQYGDIVHLRLFNRHAYIINDPDLVRFVLVEYPQYFHKTPLFKQTVRDVIGSGLLTSEDKLHKRQRKLAQPAFHHQRINAYGDVMVQYTLRMLNQWRDGMTLDVHEAMMHLTMEIVAKTLFDADVSEDAQAIGDAITSGLHIVSRRLNLPINIPSWIPTAGNRASQRNLHVLNSAIKRIIDSHRASGEDRGDLLSMLMLAEDEDGQRMSDQQLRDEAMTIFIAGHETTANALSWSLYLLAQHAEVAAHLHDEVATLNGIPPTVHDLARLPYTDMIIKEVMRLYPPAWIVPRIAIADFEMGGYPIRKESLIFTSPYAMHRHPRYYESPDRFVPERWTAEMEKSLPKYAYFPFGGGPRVCIGNGFAMMEARLILATIAQHWQLSLVPGQTIVPEPVITLRPRDGIAMTLQEQQNVPELV